MESDFVIKKNVLMKYRGQGGDVVIPEGVKIISWEAFKNCKKLTSVTFPDSLQIIKEEAFQGCSNLKELTLAGNIELIEEEAFNWCSKLKKLTIGRKVQQIQKDAFSYCYSLKELIFSDNTAEIASAFRQCSGIEKFQIFDVIFDVNTIAEKYRKEFENFMSLAFIQAYTPNEIFFKHFLSILFDDAPREKNIPKIFDEIFFTVLKNFPANPVLTRNLVKRLGKPLFQKTVQNFLAEGVITQDNIDIYIQNAIDSQMYEFQILLMDYKYQHFGFQDIGEKLKLW